MVLCDWLYLSELIVEGTKEFRGSNGRIQELWVGRVLIKGERSGQGVSLEEVVVKLDPG